MNIFEQIDTFFLKRQGSVSALGNSYLQIEGETIAHDLKETDATVFTVDPTREKVYSVRRSLKAYNDREGIDKGGLGGFGNFIRTSLISEDSSLVGLDGWKDDKEAFKIKLVDDIKNTIFAKWVKPWKPQRIAFDENGNIIIRPRNIAGRIYTRNNLVFTPEESPFFATPSYISNHNGTITDKNKGRTICSFIPQFKDKDKKNTKTKRGADYWLPKLVTVINVAYVKGIKIPKIENVEIKPAQLIEYVENFIKKLKDLKRVPKIVNNQNDSCHYKHSITWDESIEMTPPHAFKKIDYFYSVLLHEIIHSTMNPARCGRGAKLDYPNEELVAEIGSLILSSELGLDYNRQNSITYLKGWLSSTKDVDNALLEAYSYASDAVDYLLKDIDVTELLPKIVIPTTPLDGITKKATPKTSDFLFAEDAKRNSSKSKIKVVSKPTAIRKKKAYSKPTITPKVNHLPSKKKKNGKIEDSLSTKSEVNSKAIEKPSKKSKSILTKNATRRNGRVKKDSKSSEIYVVKDVAITDINTDKKRFQNRINAFSEESKNRIIKAVENSTFDYAKFDPVVLWKDAKGLIWLLSGHSRLAAFTELAKSKKDFRLIPAKFFSGSESEAIEMALNSNTLATKETEVERAIYYANSRNLCEIKSKGLNGKSVCEKQVEDKCRDAEGKNANYILNLSFLNPKGNLIADLSRYGIDKDNDNTTKLRAVANWVGEARRTNRLISDIQESEITKYLLTTAYGNKKGQFSRKQDFLDRLQWSFDKWSNRGAKESDPLNLANTVGKDIFEKEWEQRLNEAKKELETAIAEHEEKHKKYIYAVMDGTITDVRMNELLKPFVVAVEMAKKEVDKIRNQEGTVKESSKSQGTLFGLSKFSSSKKGKTEKLAGHLGEFLGEFDRQNYSIVLRGEKGAGKSRLLFQIINKFAERNFKVAFASLEMHPGSSVMQRYKEEYLSEKALDNIDITQDQLTYDQLNKICKKYDVAAIDSWTKLKGFAQTDFDRLQKENPKTIILAIFQSTTGKVTRGGNMPEFDAGVVIQVNKGGNAECEKNRYAPTDKIYNVFAQSIAGFEGEDNEEPVTETDYAPNVADLGSVAPPLVTEGYEVM